MTTDTKKRIQIVNLRNCPEVIPVLAQWFEHAFGNEDVTKESEKNWLEQSILTNDRLPVTLVAYADGTPVGTARIFTDEMDDRPQYNPWFGYWFVLPSHRKQGVGTALDQARLEAAKRENIKRIYLCTYTQKEYRLKRGWHLIEERIYYGNNASVFYKDL
ncbi:MAG: GNAT family N-acetyltransferase [Desulfobacteraceae bacterium]|nr:GNAT family N-acetyltransferase [Desulfobacteraceae bacterium]